MKSKKFDKKLKLSKSTVSNLTGRSMQEVNGGVISTICKTCGQECTIYSMPGYPCL